jgi:hypothetical protein
MSRSLRPMSLVLLVSLSGAHVRGDEFRTWTDSTGKHKTEAQFIDMRDGQVRLKKKGSGSVVAVPLEKLSGPDQRYAEASAAASAPATDVTASRLLWSDHATLYNVVFRLELAGGLGDFAVPHTVYTGSATITNNAKAKKTLRLFVDPKSIDALWAFPDRYFSVEPNSLELAPGDSKSVTIRTGLPATWFQKANQEQITIALQESKAISNWNRGGLGDRNV